MDRRKKQKEIFFTGFCVTLILAAALGAFLCVDNTLSAAGFEDIVLYRESASYTAADLTTD